MTCVVIFYYIGAGEFAQHFISKLYRAYGVHFFNHALRTGDAMDFINKVGSTIAKKAKEAAGISSLNSQISTQEEIIDKLCLEIGKTVYEKRNAFPDSELAEKYTAVSNAYAEIARLKSEIISVKGAKQCPSCGIEVALTSSFCPNCGTAVPTPEPAPYVENIEIPPDSIIYYPREDHEKNTRA